jgi:two-component system, chemotaxis family, response regulator Rcp1
MLNEALPILMFTNPQRTRPARIVLAEDNRAIARLIQIALKRTGVPHDLETVHDGHQAIAAVDKSSAESDTPDLLLLDLHMPGKDGFDVLEYIKRHALLRRIPVVMFSCTDSPADVARAYDLHVNAFVRKNTDFDDLCQTMNAILHFWLKTVVTPS